MAQRVVPKATYGTCPYLNLRMAQQSLYALPKATYGTAKSTCPYLNYVWHNKVYVSVPKITYGATCPYLKLRMAQHVRT